MSSVNFQEENAMLKNSLNKHLVQIDNLEQENNDLRADKEDLIREISFMNYVIDNLQYQNFNLYKELQDATSLEEAIR
jgi:uncharacterized protein (UPF0335 family)